MKVLKLKADEQVEKSENPGEILMLKQTIRQFNKKAGKDNLNNLDFTAFNFSQSTNVQRPNRYPNKNVW